MGIFNHPRISKQPTQDFFEYNKQSKKFSGTSIMVICCAIVVIIILYFVFLRKLDIFEGTIIAQILGHIKNEVFSYTPLGIFYTSFFGGLFFLFVPIDIIYIAALKHGANPITSLYMFTLGMILSYSLNYLIGFRLSKISKNLTSPKNFYKTKVALNKYGILAIFVMNLFGIGSQLLSFVLGAFKYNKIKFAAYCFSALIIKFVVITVIALGIFKCVGQ